MANKPLHISCVHIMNNHHSYITHNRFISHFQSPSPLPRSALRKETKAAVTIRPSKYRYYVPETEIKTRIRERQDSLGGLLGILTGLLGFIVQEWRWTSNEQELPSFQAHELHPKSRYSYSNDICCLPMKFTYSWLLLIHLSETSWEYKCHLNSPRILNTPQPSSEEPSGLNLYS